MNESIIIQKMISIGQHLEREEIFYSGAEADARALLEEIKQALTIPVVGVPTDKEERFYCHDECITIACETGDEAVRCKKQCDSCKQ